MVLAKETVMDKCISTFLTFLIPWIGIKGGNLINTIIQKEMDSIDIDQTKTNLDACESKGCKFLETDVW